MSKILKIENDMYGDTYKFLCCKRTMVAHLAEYNQDDEYNRGEISEPFPMKPRIGFCPFCGSKIDSASSITEMRNYRREHRYGNFDDTDKYMIVTVETTLWGDVIKSPHIFHSFPLNKCISVLKQLRAQEDEKFEKAIDCYHKSFGDAVDSLGDSIFERFKTSILRNKVQYSIVLKNTLNKDD